MDKVQFKVGDRVLVNEPLKVTKQLLEHMGRSFVSVATPFPSTTTSQAPRCILVMAMQHGVMVGITYPMSINIWSLSPPNLMFQKSA